MSAPHFITEVTPSAYIDNCLSVQLHFNIESKICQHQLAENGNTNHFCVKHIKKPCRSTLFCTTAWENDGIKTDQASSLVWVTSAASRTRRMALLVSTLRTTAASNSASQ